MMLRPIPRPRPRRIDKERPHPRRVLRRIEQRVLALSWPLSPPAERLPFAPAAAPDNHAIPLRHKISPVPDKLAIHAEHRSRSSQRRLHLRLRISTAPATHEPTAESVSRAPGCQLRVQGARARSSCNTLDDLELSGARAPNLNPRLRITNGQYHQMLVNQSVPVVVLTRPVPPAQHRVNVRILIGWKFFPSKYADTPRQCPCL